MLGLTDRHIPRGLTLAVVLAVAATAPAEEPAAGVDPQVARQVGAAIAALNAESFALREEAAGRLDELVGNPGLGAYLADEFSRVLLAADTSSEVRAQLERLLKELPAPAALPASQKPTAAEIGPLLDRLNSDRLAPREAARRQLETMLAHVELVAPMLAEVKQRLADPDLSRQARWAMELVLDKTREAWVNADPARVPLPAITSEQMTRWLDHLASVDAEGAAGRVERATAERELIDLLVRDDTRAPVLALLEQRIAAAADADTAARLREITDFARPAMAAEVWGHQKEDHEAGQGTDWQHRQHIWVQHMIVGVPQLVEAAARPTHFDRIDDHTAHCVSGNSLTPGDYPVGVAIPNPNPSYEVMYYLVNLPTPRRRLAYAYHLKRDESERLAEISQRTLDDFLANRRPLDDLRVMMLRQLDPRAVSRFVGPYFQAVPDAPLQSAGGDPAPGRATLHAAICAALCTVGTREAVPALQKLARSGQLAKPSYENNVNVAWVALLAIANSDPWPGVDAWLAGLIDETEPLIVNIDPVPDLGASAAGLLLERHQASPRSFDLEPTEEVIEPARFSGFHFTSDEGRDAVRRWWSRQQASEAKESAP